MYNCQVDEVSINIPLIEKDEVIRMKINDTQRITAAQQYQRQYAAQRAEKPAMRKDELSISTEAKEMLDAQSKVQDPSRAERIQDLKEAVSTGTYHVDAEKVAEKLMPFFLRHKQ